MTGPPQPSDRLAEEAAGWIRESSVLVPRVAIVLGSGLGLAVAEDLDEEASFGFAELPGFAAAGVPGHAGRVVLGSIAEVPVVAFLGRVHLYEGHGTAAPAMMPRLAHALGAHTMVLTAAVGGLREDLAAGTLVVITDHLNHMGVSPLQGWRSPDGTPAFVPMRGAYDAAAAELTLERAQALGLRVETGVYAAMAGPAFETPAELEHLRGSGATVVGMSIVPEALPARALGMRLVGICMVTNAFGEDVSHAEVLRVSNETAASVGKLLVDLLPRLEGEG